MSLIPIAKPFHPLTPLTAVDSNSSNGTPNITYPSLQAGDLLLLADFGVNSVGGAPSSVLLSGFTAIINEAVGNARLIVSYKIADGTETGTATGMDATSTIAKLIAAFRGNYPARRVFIGDPHVQVTTNNPDPQTIAASATCRPLVVFGVYCADGGIPFADAEMTPAPDGSLVQSATVIRIKWKDYTHAVPQNVEVNQPDDGSNATASFYLKVR